jgi:hypothetical protein
MTLQALPRRVASLSPSTPTHAHGRLSTVCPRLWPNLSGEAQTQLAQAMAQLLRRHRRMEEVLRTEVANADDIPSR